MFINDLNNTPKLNGTRRHGIIIELDTGYIRTLDPEVREVEGPNGNILYKDTGYYHFEKIMDDTIDDLDKNYNKYFKTTYNVEIDLQDIDFPQPKYNFYFIHRDWLEKNQNLQQTIRWGTYNPFDPLAD